MVRGRALELYREAFTEILQDGDVTPQQQELLQWLQAETGLGPGEIATFTDRL